MLFLGVDVGTQRVKTGILDSDSQDISFVASRGYPSGAVQPAGEISEATLEAIAETVTRCGNAGAIKAVGLSGQMHGTVLYDNSENVLGDIINWQDESCNQPLDMYSGATTIEHVIELIKNETVDDLGIDRMSSGFMGATLFFIKENQPDLFKRVAHVLFPTDFIRRVLTGGGPFATDPTNGFGSGVFNTRECRWHEAVISRMGLPLEIFPEVRGTGEAAGEICSIVAEKTGLLQGTPVVTGGGDNQMAMIGSGAFSPGGPLCVNIGTSSQICAVVGEYRKIDGIDTRSFISGNYALVYPGLTGGKSYTWLKNNVVSDMNQLEAKAPPDAEVFRMMDTLASRVPSGCEGLEFKPTLRGTRRNPSERGAFTGIGEHNFSLGHRARAVMEGVVAELLDSYNLIGDTGSHAIVGAGNGIVKSAVWRKITADAFNIPLKIADMENAVFGAAVVAACGLGMMRFDDININYTKVVYPGEK